MSLEAVKVPFNISDNYNDERCLGILTMLDLIESCEGLSNAERFAIFSCGIAAVMLLPTAIYGTFGNIILILFLGFKIRRPKNLELFGILLAILDIVDINLSGLLYSALAFGLPWWGYFIPPVQQWNHISCKLMKYFTHTLTGLRINLMLFVILNELQLLTHGNNDGNCNRQKFSKILLSLLIVFSVSIIQGFPSFLIHGMWIKSGTFYCYPDPQWAYKYHVFYTVHRILFLEGLVQCLCALALSIIMWYNLKQNEKTIIYLKNTPNTGDIVSRVLIGIELQMEDLCRNYRIVLTQTYVMCIFRLIRCAARLVHYLSSSFGKTQYSKKVRFQQIVTYSQRNVLTFIETILVSFTFMWWYTNLPEIQLYFQNLWQKLFHRRRYKIEKRTKAYNKTYSYYEQVAIIYGEDEKGLQKERKILNQLKHLKTHIKDLYENELSQLKSNTKKPN